MTLGQRIQQLRKEHGLSQEALGEQLGVSRQAISKWESDITIPEIDKLIALAKLFGVSVGALLGVEEDDPAAPAAEELTDRELLAIEAIVGRYLEKAQKQPKSRRKIWPVIVGWAVVLFLVFWFKGQLETLDGRLSNLQSNINSIDNSVSSQISSMSGQIKDLLEEEASLLADYRYDVTAVDIVAGTLTMDIEATPKNYTEGMELIFTADLPDGDPLTCSGELSAGHSFQAKGWTLPLNDEIKLSATFGTDGSWQTQTLETLTRWSSNTTLVVDASLHESGRLTAPRSQEVLWISEQWVNGYFVHKSKASSLADVTAVDARLELHKNNRVLETTPVTLHSIEHEITRFSCPTFEISVPVQAGDRLTWVLVHTDNYGRQVSQSLKGVTFSTNEQGELTHMYEAPAMPGGSSVSYNYIASD